MKKRLSTCLTTTTVVALFVLFSTGWQAPVGAQSEVVSQTSLPEQARQFDFWHGNWTLTVAGAGVTTSSITSFGIGGGIATLESYGGGYGTSVSVYSPKEQRWYQTWFDQDQLLIEGVGEFKDGRMALVGPHTDTRTGFTATGRLSWFNISANQLEFFYELSTNGGQSWQPNFSAHLARAAAGQAEDVATPASTVTPTALPTPFRQFDFLVGTWEVTLADCPAAGTSTVTLFGQGGGIAVLEDWRCGDSYRNTSVSFYHTPSGKWRHLALDTNNLLLEMTGTMQGNEMMLEGEFTDPQSGQTLLGRSTYHNITAASFDRKLEVSEDNGQTWTVRHTAHYSQATVVTPAGFRARKVKAGKVVLAWEDNSPAENRFEILRWDGAQWVLTKTAAAGSGEIVVKKLQSATTYQFAIRACDAQKCSEPTTLTVTTR